MAASLNTRAVLVSRPTGPLAPENFRVEQVPCAEPADGEVLVEVHSIDVQPAMRGWTVERRAYTPPIELGGTMRAQGVGRVLVSRHTEWREGDHGVEAFPAAVPMLFDGRSFGKLMIRVV